MQTRHFYGSSFFPSGKRVLLYFIQSTKERLDKNVEKTRLGIAHVTIFSMRYPSGALCGGRLFNVAGTYYMQDGIIMSFRKE